MMRNPAHSRFGSSSAPSPHRNELPGAENSASVNTSPTVEKALMLKSPPMKSTLCSLIYSIKALEKLSRCITFLSHDIVNVY